METIIARHWHHLPAEEVAELLGTEPDIGLDTFETARRREHFGPNVLPAQEGVGQLTRFLLQFHQPLVYILLAAAARPVKMELASEAQR